MPPTKCKMYLFIATFGIERLRMSSFVHTLIASGDEYENPPPEEKEQDANSRMEMSSTPAQDVYEIRPLNDRDGFGLISDRLRRKMYASEIP
jgi:hypothetical protein